MYNKKLCQTECVAIFVTPKSKVMRHVLLLVATIVLFACGNNKNAETAKMFCDTACLTDTIKFTKEDHKLRPYLYITAKNCLPDSVIWSYSGLGTNRKLSFDDFGLKKLLLKLKDEQRLLIDLSFFQGYTHEQIANALHIPLGTVNTRIRSALIQLRALMQ